MVCLSDVAAARCGAGYWKSRLIDEFNRRVISGYDEGNVRAGFFRETRRKATAYSG